MSAGRICPKPGCPNFIPSGAKYCEDCQRATWAARGTSTQRGYDSDHNRRAKAAKARAIRNQDLCAMCGKPMLRGQDLHYDHETPLAVDRSSRANRVVHGACNASAGGRLGNPKGQPK